MLQHVAVCCAGPMDSVGGNYAVIRGVALIPSTVRSTQPCSILPLEQIDRFPSLSRDQSIPARVEGNHLFIRLPNGKEAKATITRHESLHPNRPQSA